jgi:hypothetical protein
MEAHVRTLFACTIVAVGCLTATSRALAQEEPSSPLTAATEAEPAVSLTEQAVPGFPALPIAHPRAARPPAQSAQYQMARQPAEVEEVAPQAAAPQSAAIPPQYMEQPWTDEPVYEESYGPEVGPQHGWDEWGHSHDGCQCNYCCNPWRFSVDFLSMQPRFSGQDFAIIDPNTDSQPDGRFATLDASRAGGLQLYFGRELMDGWDTMIRYTYLSSNDSQFVQAPTGGQLWATMAHPNTVNVANTANAGLKFKYHVLDAELGHDLSLAPNLDTRIFGGSRFAWIDHDISVIYNGSDATFDQILSPLKFTGYGLRLGGQTKYRLPAGWSLFGEASTGLLVGTIDTGLFESSNHSTSTVVNVSDRQTFGTPVLELGIGASRNWGPWEIQAGYRFTQWFNVLQHRDFSDDLHSGKSIQRNSDLMLDGFFVGLGLGR